VPDSGRGCVTALPFAGLDPFHELALPTNLAARKAIADELWLPLGKLSDDDRAFITDLLGRTLAKPEVMADWRMIAAVPTPSADNKMILARQTCFCAALRSLTTCSSRRRSGGETSNLIPVRMAQNRTPQAK